MCIDFRVLKTESELKFLQTLHNAEPIIITKGGEKERCFFYYLVCMWWVSPVLSTEYTPESGLKTDTLWSGMK